MLRAALLSPLLLVSLATSAAAQPGFSSLSSVLSGVSAGELAREARERGDSRRGAVLFHQQRLMCARCHEGTKSPADGGPTVPALGPDLARLPTPVDAAELARLVALEPDDPLAEAEYRKYMINRVLDLVRTEFEPITWRAFHEHAILGLTPAEVAVSLGITTNAVYLAKRRVLRRLREEFDGLLDYR